MIGYKYTTEELANTDFMPNIGMYEYIFYFTDKVNDRVAIESNINTYYSIY